MRFHTLVDRGFFFDELWNIQVSNGQGSAFLNLPLDQLIDVPNTLALANAKPILSVPANITGVIHPPGLFFMLRLWREVFGDSMFAVRSFSATWSTLMVVLVFVAARLSFDAPVGLWAAFMAAIAFNNIEQAQDARGYTLLQCELLLTTIALLLARRRTSSWIGAAAVGIGTLAMMFSHYFAAGACVAIVFGVVTLLRGRSRSQALAAIGVAGVIWVLLWAPQLRKQLAFVPETADGFLHDKSDLPWLTTLERLAASTYQATLGDPRDLHPITIAGGLIIAAAIALGVRLRPATEKPAARFWLAVVIGVIGSLVILDLARQTSHLKYTRYFVLATPAICVLLASIRIGRPWIAPAVISVALGVLLFTTPLPMKAEERAATAWLNARVKPGDIVFLPSYNSLGRDGQVMSLYFEYGVPLDRVRMIIPVRKPRAAVLDALPRDVRWFYYSFDRNYEPTTWLPRVEVVEAGPVGDGAVYEIRPRAPRSTTEPTTSPSTSRPARTISVQRRWPEPTTKP